MAVRRTSINDNRGTNAYDCASTFYGLEALKVQVQFHKNYSVFLKSNSKLLEDIIEYQKTLAEHLAKMLYDYSVITCYGELRHCAKTSQVRYKGAGLPANSGGRNSAYEKSLNYSPTQILELCIEAFDPSNKWSSSYGGEKWQAIAKHAIRYGKIDNLIFCDTAFSLSHNCSPFLNKIESNIFYINDTDKYVNLLDTKFSESLLNTLSYIVCNVKRIDLTFKNLIIRAYNLGFIPYNASGLSRYNISFIKTIDLPLLLKTNYRPLVYQHKKMSPKKLHSWCNTLKEQKFYDKLEIGMHVMFHNENSLVYFNPHEKNRNKKPYMHTFSYIGEYNISQLKYGLNFQNTFENLKIVQMNREEIGLESANGDRIYTHFRNIIAINDKLKTIKMA